MPLPPFPTHGINGNRSMWTELGMRIVQDRLHATQTSGQPIVYDFLTSQEAKQNYGNIPIATEDTYRENPIPRQLLSGTDTDILKKLEEVWNEQLQIWADSGTKNQFDAIRDQMTDTLEFTWTGQIRQVVFLGLGSLQDRNYWPNSFIGHIAAEAILAILRSRFHCNFRIIFEDTSYTNLDAAFINYTFGRHIPKTPVGSDETTYHETSSIRVYNIVSGLEALDDDPKTPNSWNKVLYVTSRSRNPYRQILAQLSLERLKAGKTFPRAVICVPFDDNDDDNGSRNYSSDKVKEWLTKYPSKLTIFDHRHPVLGQLCLYARPDTISDPL